MMTLAKELAVILIKTVTTSSCKIAEKTLPGQGLYEPLSKVLVKTHELKFGLAVDATKYQLQKEPGDVLDTWEKAMISAGLDTLGTIIAKPIAAALLGTLSLSGGVIIVAGVGGGLLIASKLEEPVLEAASKIRKRLQEGESLWDIYVSFGDWLGGQDPSTFKTEESYKEWLREQPEGTVFDVTAKGGVYSTEAALTRAYKVAARAAAQAKREWIGTPKSNPPTWDSERECKRRMAVDRGQVLYFDFAGRETDSFAEWGNRRRYRQTNPVGHRKKDQRSC